MFADAVLQELYRTKDRIAEECGFDSTRFAAAIREIELRYPERIVTLADQIPPTGGEDVPDENPLVWHDPIVAEVHRIREELYLRKMAATASVTPAAVAPQSQPIL